MTCFNCPEIKCSGACGISVSIRDIVDYKTYKEVIERRNNILEEYVNLCHKPEFENLKEKLLQKKVFRKLHKVEDLDDLNDALEDFESLSEMLKTQID